MCLVREICLYPLNTNAFHCAYRTRVLAFLSALEYGLDGGTNGRQDQWSLAMTFNRVEFRSFASLTYEHVLVMFRQTPLEVGSNQGTLSRHVRTRLSSQPPTKALTQPIMPPRSKRALVEQPSNGLDGDEFDNSEFDAEFEDSKAPPRKKRKTTANAEATAPKTRTKKLAKTQSFDPKWSHTRGRRGLLKQLATEAPLDVLFEVTDHHFVFK